MAFNVYFRFLFWNFNRQSLYVQYHAADTSDPIMSKTNTPNAQAKIDKNHQNIDH